MNMLSIIKQASIVGGDVLKSYFRNNLEVSYKTDIHDLVTQADKEAQKIIIDFITKESQKINKDSNIGFIGEEGIFENSDYTFIIDPLDGTTNFASGIDNFCVSIAVSQKNDIYCGVIYDVMRNNLFWAENGKGAYKNNERLKIPQNKKLSEAILLVHFSSVEKNREKLMNIIRKTADKIRSVRALGAIALDLCRLSEGTGDIALNLRTNIWDIAAGSLILSEAGGETLDLQGKGLVYDFVHNPQKKYEILAGEKNILKNFLSIL